MMITTVKAALTAFVVGLFVLGTPSQGAFAVTAVKDRVLERGNLSLVPCVVRGANRLGDCATIDVPLDYGNPDGQAIEVHVSVLSAEGTGTSKDPVFIFAGGPGQAAGEYGVIAEIVFRETMRRRDIVLVDARGTGLSTPMQCEQSDETGPFDLEGGIVDIRACRTAIDFDVRYINLETIVQDIDRVREALGYETINVWGGSYGTRVIAHYVRRFPARVRSIIADGILPPDIALFETAGQSAGRAKDLLVEDCMNRPDCAARFPDLDAQIQALTEDAKAGRLVFDGIDPFTGEPLVGVVPYEFFVESLRSVMYSADGTVVLPLSIEAATNGNLQPLLAGMLGGDAGMYIGMTLSVLCGEELARLTPEQAKKAGEGTFAGDSYYRFWARNCDVWDYFTRGNGLPDDIHDPVNTDIPALILSGNVDPITPPSMGDHLAKSFTNSQHIIVNGTGHIASMTGCMPSLIHQFIEDLDPQAVDASCLGHLRRLPAITGINGQVSLTSDEGDAQ